MRVTPKFGCYSHLWNAGTPPRHLRPRANDVHEYQYLARDLLLKGWEYDRRGARAREHGAADVEIAGSQDLCYLRVVLLRTIGDTNIKIEIHPKAIPQLGTPVLYVI